VIRVDGLQEIFSRARAVLLDFDGPVCSVFSGISDLQVSSQLRAVLSAYGVDVPAEVEEAHDPLAVLRFSATAGRDVLLAVEERFQAAEVNAVAVADPTPYAFDFIRAARQRGKVLAIVSNNSAAAAAAYLEQHGLSGLFGSIAGRAYAAPDLMKPHPDSVMRALASLELQPNDAVLIGDSVTDMEVCQVTGVPCIGYANKPGKAQFLVAAGADEVVEGPDGMGDLVKALAVMSS
jgi:phosphoglycolate phosphatase-like HAD superfamily hydrolase